MAGGGQDAQPGVGQEPVERRRHRGGEEGVTVAVDYEGWGGDAAQPLRLREVIAVRVSAERDNPSPELWL